MTSDPIVTQAGRPETTNRECTVCGAIVAAWPDAMCCHCTTRPWRRIASQTVSPEALVEALEAVRDDFDVIKAHADDGEPILCWEAARDAIDKVDAVLALARQGDHP